MRITENLITTNFLLNLNKNKERITELQKQIASGVVVAKASDNPEAMNKILDFKNAISRNEHYTKNVTEAQTRVESSSAALENLSGVLLEIKQLISRANASHSPNFNDYANQLENFLDDAVRIGNTKFNGKYIFGGTNTLDAPFTLSVDRTTVTMNSNGISGIISLELGEGFFQQVNIPGNEAFSGTSIFDTIIQLRDSYRSGEMPPSSIMVQVDTHLSSVLAVEARTGSILENLSLFELSLEQSRTQLLSFLSRFQDTDIAEAVMELKQEELKLNAALNIGAQILPKSLIDYLR